MGISYDVKTRPGISNLLNILSATDTIQRSPEQLAKEFSTCHPRVFKKIVAEAVVAEFRGVSCRYRELIDEKNHILDQVEAQGAWEARQNAEKTMERVRSAIGL